jgi:hypothetical protein
MIARASLCSFAVLALLLTGCPPPTTGGGDGGGCSAANCASGCCSNGACQTGTSSTACGTGGQACQACSGGTACTAQGTCGSAATCNPQNCSSGCCAPNGSCITPSNTIFACGANGGACSVCSGQQACTNGACTNTGTCSGCVDLAGQCQPGTTTADCGNNGAACQPCQNGQSCTAGQCTSPCNSTTCANGCCNGNNCVLYPNQNNFQCGSGGVTCGACTNGHSCNGSGQCSGGGSCTAANCPSGCCNGNTCVPYASENNNQCGTGGASCAACGTGQSCNPSGQCTGESCSSANCPSGCCNGSTCVPYANENNNQCGASGAACAACGTGLSCNGSGQCTGTTGCNSSNCAGGCCNGSTCVPYASENNNTCGTGGAACAACTTGQTCNTGACTGGGTVGNNGGSVPSLYFAVVGDTRPGSNNANSSYPTAIITKIYQDLEALNPKPQFILTTGDYQFDDPGATTGGQLNSDVQIGYYAQAQTNWTGGPVFMAMGNHECNGYTNSNLDLTQNPPTCDGVASTNYTSWYSKLVAPLGKTLPYYTIPINATDGSWTSKFIIVACNAWDSTQQTWLQTQLATPTTYTFLVRHEDPTATTGPCVSAMDSMLASATYTALIVGHVHQYCSGTLSSSTSCEYPWTGSPKGFVVGNGGAVTSNDGYVTVQQNGSTFTVTDFDYSTNGTVASFTFQ